MQIQPYSPAHPGQGSSMQVTAHAQRYREAESLSLELSKDGEIGRAHV